MNKKQKLEAAKNVAMVKGALAIMLTEPRNVRYYPGMSAEQHTVEIQVSPIENMVDLLEKTEKLLE